MRPDIPALNCVQLSPCNSQYEEWLLFAKKIRKGLGNGTDFGSNKRFYYILLATSYQKSFLPGRENHYIFHKKQGTSCTTSKEHDDIRELILSPNRDSDRSHFSIPANFIENHTRFEKYNIFSFLANILSPEQSDAISNDLEKHPVICKEWKHEFWVKR